MTYSRTDTKRDEGNVALITVIVLSGMLLASGVAILLLNMSIVLSVKDAVSSTRLTMLSRTCLEESLYRIKWDTGYTGSFSVGDEPDGCTSTVADDPINPQVKAISIQVFSGEYFDSLDYRVDTSVQPYAIE